jgi:hypothetical protein
MANIQIPVFNPVNPANITQQEWDLFEEHAQNAFDQLVFTNHIMDPTFVTPTLNPAFTGAPG